VLSHQGGVARGGPTPPVCEDTRTPFPARFRLVIFLI
jgi:hypothetical protein